jgi:hypothetical protein
VTLRYTHGSDDIPPQGWRNNWVKMMEAAQEFADYLNSQTAGGFIIRVSLIARTGECTVEGKTK